MSRESKWYVAIILILLIFTLGAMVGEKSPAAAQAQEHDYMTQDLQRREVAALESIAQSLRSIDQKMKR